jgi:hypothetical protein
MLPVCRPIWPAPGKRCRPLSSYQGACVQNTGGTELEA